MSKGLWGADQTDERKPTWPWVSEYIGYANCFATGGGWTIRWPWGDEVIVALSNLTSKLGNADVTAVTALAFPAQGVLSNVAAMSLQVSLSFNEPITVTGTPTLQLISEVGEANGGSPANITLSYNASVSNLTSGKIVFGNSNFTLATAAYAYDNLIINSTSIVAGWDGIKDAGSANVVANGVPEAYSLTIPVYQDVPVHYVTLRPDGANTAKDTSNQVIAFMLDFNDAVTVTGTPFIIAIGPNTGIANLQLTYDSGSSCTAMGALVFKSAAQNFSALTGNCTFTLTTNGASVNSSDGWAGITGVAPLSKVVSHGIAVANTFLVQQCEPFVTGCNGSANVTNTTDQVVAFTLVFDRAAVVNTTGGQPSVVAISNGALANLTLNYATGTGTTNLVFQSANLDLSAAANQAWFVNSSSVIAGFSRISNNGVSSDLTGTLTVAVSNTGLLVSA